LKYCEHGYQTDPKTGCQTCICNETPFCVFALDKDTTSVASRPADGTATSTAVAVAFTDVCRLDCKYGYIKDVRGCPTCACAPTPVECFCVKPLSYSPFKCSDGSFTYLTDVCAKTLDGKCAYRERRCPIIIVIRVDSELSDAEKAFIFDTIVRYSGTVSELDVKIEKSINPDTNKVEYRVIIESDAISRDDASGNEMATNIQNDGAISSKGGSAFVLSDSGASGNTSFASVIVVPILGALLSFLF
jgi:hypothetical protein